MNQSTCIYQDMAARTQNSIYIGVVGPVRTGKSTFIKRFMETQVIPHIDNVYRRDRATDELPQSGSGRTIMTAEPKFVPEEAVEVHLDEGVSFSVRMIDCVGYMVPGAVGQFEDLAPRMVMTPWYDYEIPMTEAAEIGTRKVITEHSTIGIVITTDGTVTDIPRQDYQEAEERVIRELQEIGKPFVVLLNSSDPTGERACAISTEISGKYNVKCIPVNCLTLDETAITALMRSLLFEFPLQELDLYLPSWVEALPLEHPIKSSVYQTVREEARQLTRIRELDGALDGMRGCDSIQGTVIRSVDLGTGVAQAELQLPRSLFYDTLSQRSGLTVTDDGDLMELLTELGKARQEYDKVAAALKSARENGYGIVMPGAEELKLEKPEIVKKNGNYAVKLRASAPSIHMLRAQIETEISPMVGGEQESQQLIDYLLGEYEEDTDKLWQSNIFGKSLYELVSEGVTAKIMRMPDDARQKLTKTLGRMINENTGGMICILL